MYSWFLVGITVLVVLILSFHSAGFSAPIADNQTAGKESVTLKPCWGRGEPKRATVIDLALIAQWTQETGFWKLLSK
jgi:hypothetical protein